MASFFYLFKDDISKSLDMPTTLTKGGRNEPKIAIRIENSFGCMITDKVQVTQKEDK